MEVRQDGFTCRTAGSVATVTLTNGARRNVQGPRLWGELTRLGQDLAESVEVVVLRAEGPSFSAGLDRALLTPAGSAGEAPLTSLGTLDDERLMAAIEEFQAAFTWWHRPDLVSIAVVEGHAVGAGCQLAVACDLRVGTPAASFALAEPRLGLVPDLGGTRRVRTLVGLSRAVDLVVTGREVGAEEAHRIGLLDRLVESAELDRTVDELVRDILSTDRRARVAAKALMVGADRRNADEQRAAERLAQVPLVRRLFARSPSA